VGGFRKTEEFIDGLPERFQPAWPLTRGIIPMISFFASGAFGKSSLVLMSDGPRFRSLQWVEGR